MVNATALKFLAMGRGSVGVPDRIREQRALAGWPGLLRTTGLVPLPCVRPATEEARSAVEQLGFLPPGFGRRTASRCAVVDRHSDTGSVVSVPLSARKRVSFPLVPRARRRLEGGL